MKMRATALLLALLGTQAASGQIIEAGINSAGAEVYARVCATCHDMPEATRSPPLDTLRRMGPRAISHALTHGKMRVQGASLSAQEVDDVVSWLIAATDVDNNWVGNHLCPAPRNNVDRGTPTIWTQGFDLR